jgi:hypothetical protein
MHVLVLNQDFSPIMICTVQRAFLLVYLNKAELISIQEDKKLRTINTTFPFPSIIRLDRYIPIPYKGVVLTRQNVLKRDNFECQYCGNRKDLTLDHLVPRSKGGRSTWTNLVTACKPCNSHKSDHSLEEVNFQLSKQPVKPSYLMFIRNTYKHLNQDWLTYLEPNAYKFS